MKDTPMTSEQKKGSHEPDACPVLWQGFRHAWDYNHRLNRFGSYVRHGRRPDGSREAVVGHTAASGTGGDRARFTEYVTPITSPDVGIQTGEGETTVECIRAETNPFRIKVDGLELEPDLQGKDNLTVVINGFDLIAERHADKLIAFDLEVTDPTVYAGGTQVRFNILGSLRFDCRTGECQLWPFRLEVEDVERRRRSRKFRNQAPPDDSQRPSLGIPRYQFMENSVSWLKRQVARFTDLENVKEAVVGDDNDTLRRRLFRVLNKQFYLALLKWRIATPYILRVYYTIIAGDNDSLTITESDVVENDYHWDAVEEIHREDRGTVPVRVRGAPPAAYALNTLAFKHLYFEAEMDRIFSADNPIQWGQGMHLLEWDVAVRNIQPVDGHVTAAVDLFYKAWSEAMNEVITLTTWGALRSAGRARLGARLVLLQFKGGGAAQLALPGQIRWPGGGINARNHPRAQYERSPTIPAGDKG